MHKAFIKTATYLGALAVIFGAFGAHKLKDFATPAILATFETAVRYQFYHVFALLFTALIYKEFPVKLIQIAGKLFIAGMAVFSGSLYVMTGLFIAGFDQFKWIGAITPIGGLLLVTAWICLAVGIKKHTL